MHDFCESEECKITNEIETFFLLKKANKQLSDNFKENTFRVWSNKK